MLRTWYSHPKLKDKFYAFQIVARYKTDVSSEFELVISLNFDLKLYYHGLFCSVSALKDFDVQKMTVSALLYKISQLHVCAGNIAAYTYL